MSFEDLRENSREKSYNRRRENLKKAFEKYRNMPAEAPIRQLLERTLVLYKDICVQKGPEAERRYRALKHHYILPKHISHRDFADYEHIEVRTYYKDVSIVLDDLMVLVYGVDGISGYLPENDYSDADIRQIIEAEIREKVTDELMKKFKLL